MAGYPDYEPPQDAADPAVIEAAVEAYLDLNPPGIPDHNDTTLRDAAAAHPATAITVDAAGFNGNLTTADDTVQEVAQKLDDLVIPAAYTDEQVRDVIGTALVAGSNVTITPNDGADTITIAASGGSVATDTVWDAAGDLVYGTAADAATRLALGTRGQALVAGATAPEWAFITPRLNVPMATNDWVLLSTGFGTGSMGTTIGGTATSSNNNSRYVPFFVGKRIGVNGLGIEVSTGNAGGSAVIRLGIHANNAGRPGSVVVDAGTASAGAAAKELSFTEVFLDPGWYFAVVVFQDLDTAGTNPAVRGAAAMGSTATRTSVPAASTQQVSWGATVSGALSANPTVINTGALVIPHIWLKVSTL